MSRRIVGIVVLALLGAFACSDSPRLAPPPESSPEVVGPPLPQVFASGTVVSGLDGGTPIEWDLEEIVGFSHAVTLTAATETTVSVRSASRQGTGDELWLVGASLTADGPAVVFGGADGQIDSLVVVNGDGEELSVDLIEVPELDWHLAIEELPTGWSSADTEQLQVVARRAGVEVAREPLAGLTS